MAEVFLHFSLSYLADAQQIVVGVKKNACVRKEAFIIYRGDDILMNLNQ